MGFKLATTWRGIDFPDAYWTVEKYTVEGTQIDVYVTMRANEKAGGPPLYGDTVGGRFDPQGAPPMEQAYSLLLSLDRFKGAK